MKTVIERLDDLVKSVEEFEKAAKTKKNLACADEDEMEEADKAKKADLGEYWKKPKKPESEAPTIRYGGGTHVSRTPGTPEVEAGFKAPKAKVDKLKDPSFQAKLVQQRRQANFKKSEDMGKITSEALTKSMLQKHQPKEIEAMLRAGVEEGKLHRNILLEFQNFGTVNTAVLGLASDEE